MNFLNVFEDHVACMLGATRAPFSFRKLAKQAVREMEQQTLVINEVDTAPALYTILVSPDDDPLLSPHYPELSREVGDFVKAQAEKKRYVFVGDPIVRFMIDPVLKEGRFTVFADNVDAPALAKLYEEERAFQNGEPQRDEIVRERRRPLAAAPLTDARIPAIPNPATAAANPLAPVAPAVAAAAVPERQAVAREAPRGMGGAAATNGTQIPHVAPAPARPRARLVDVVTGDTFEISSASCVIGREPSATDIALRDPNVSRRHARFAFTGADWSIEDLNSTNGTLVNNQPVTRRPLRNGDLLTFGLSTFEFRG